MCWRECNVAVIAIVLYKVSLQVWLGADVSEPTLWYGVCERERERKGNRERVGGGVWVERVSELILWYGFVCEREREGKRGGGAGFGGGGEREKARQRVCVCICLLCMMLIRDGVERKRRWRRQTLTESSCRR